MNKIFWFVKALLTYSVSSFCAILLSLFLLWVLGKYSFELQFHLKEIVSLSIKIGVVLSVVSALMVFASCFFSKHD